MLGSLRHSRGMHLASAFALMLLVASTLHAEEILRAGVVGCDTSHAVAFTKLINSPKAKGRMAAIKVTAAYPGGSPDIASSRDRVKGFTRTLDSMGVKIVDSLDELADQCDVFLLESVDGRVHLEQFRAIAKGKPVFIDKPAAASLSDLIAIFRLAEETHTPCFSSSALRFCGEVTSLKKAKKVGALSGVETTCPYKTDPTHPDLFWYGIHGVESLYALMGTGCKKVTCVEGERGCVATGVWSDGRCGVYRGLAHAPRGRGAFSYTLYGDKAIHHASGFDGYGALVGEICEFFHTHKPPVSPQETIEMFAFMEAAEASKNDGGRAVAIAEWIAEAQKKAAAKE